MNTEDTNLADRINTSELISDYRFMVLIRDADQSLNIPAGRSVI
ncbi:MAG: hypothetical protein ACOYXB_07840 [Bacteroidota bacterium]